MKVNRQALRRGKQGFVEVPHLGFEVVPGRQCPLASELQRWTALEVSFAAEHQRRTAFRAPTPECIRAPTPDCIRAPTPDYIRGVVNHLGSKKFEGV